MARPDETDLAFPVVQIMACDTVFDVVAIPLETSFLAQAQAAGKRMINGGEVAALQALEQFVLYTGITPAEVQINAAVSFARAS